MRINYGKYRTVLATKLFNLDGVNKLLELNEDELNSFVMITCGLGEEVFDKIMLAAECKKSKGYIPSDLLDDIYSMGVDILIKALQNMIDCNPKILESIKEVNDKGNKVYDISFDYELTYLNISKLLSNEYSAKRVTDKLHQTLLTYIKDTNEISEERIFRIYDNLLKTRFNKLHSLSEFDFKHTVFKSRISSIVSMYESIKNETTDANIVIKDMSERVTQLSLKEEDYDKDYNSLKETLEVKAIEEIIIETEDDANVKINDVCDEILSNSKSILDLDITSIKDIPEVESLNVDSSGLLLGCMDEISGIIKNNESNDSYDFNTRNRLHVLSLVIYVIGLAQEDISKFLEYRTRLYDMIAYIKKDTFNVLKETNDLVNVNVM